MAEAMNGERSKDAATRAASGEPWSEKFAFGLELPVISLEQVVYVLLAILALLLRLVPVDTLREPADTARAAAALDAARGIAVPATEIIGTRVLFLAERIAFWLLPDGVITARLFPALCGVAIVLLFRRFSGHIGQVGAIAAASIVALGPLWIEQGRGVSDASLASLAILLLAYAVISRRGLAVAVLAAVAVAMLGWTAIPLASAAAAWSIATVLRRAAPDQGLMSLWPVRRDQQNAAIAFVATLVLATTSFMTRPTDLFIGLAGGMSAWTDGLRSSGDVWGGYVVPLIVYAPICVGFGVPGLIALGRQRGFFGVWLAMWAALACIVGVVTSSVGALPEILIPLTLGAGFTIDRLVALLLTEARWAEDGIMIWLVLIIASYGLFHALRYADTGLVVGENTSDPLRMVFGSIGMIALLAIVLMILWGTDMAIRVMGTSALLILGALAISNGSQLNYGSSVEIVRPVRIENGAEQLAADLKGILTSSAGDLNARTVGIDPELEEILAWSFRNSQSVTLLDNGEVNSESESLEALVLVGGSVPNASLFGDQDQEWLKQDYVIASQWTPSFLDLQGFLRWYLQRRVGEGEAGALLADPPTPVSVSAYFRNR